MQKRKYTNGASTPDSTVPSDLSLPRRMPSPPYSSPHPPPSPIPTLLVSASSSSPMSPFSRSSSRSVRTPLLFTVIILIVTGWSFLKPFLQEKEKKVLMIVIPLQVLANIASIVIGETGPFIKDWVTWNQVFLLVDIICCCAIIFPIVWSIRSLRETSKTDGKTARNLAKLTLFRQFYMVVIGYLYFKRIVVFALRTIATYKYQWVSNAAEEIASFAFYVVMFYMFRHVEKNEYFVLDQEEEEEEKRC